MVTVGILTFIQSWNSFLWPLLVTNTKEFRLLNNGLSAFTTEAGSDVHFTNGRGNFNGYPNSVNLLCIQKEIIRGLRRMVSKDKTTITFHSGILTIGGTVIEVAYKDSHIFSTSGLSFYQN